MDGVALVLHKAAIGQGSVEMNKLPPSWTISAGWDRSNEGSTITHGVKAHGDGKKGDAALGVPILPRAHDDDCGRRASCGRRW